MGRGALGLGVVAAWAERPAGKRARGPGQVAGPRGVPGPTGPQKGRVAGWARA